MPEILDSGVPAPQYGFDVERFFSTVTHPFLGSDGGAGGVFTFLSTLWTVYSVIAFLASAFFLFGFIYAKIRFSELAAIRDAALHDAEHALASHHHEKKNKRWEDVVAHIESDSPNDWRLAIIEADIMLDDLLNTLGLSGMTIGDKLKGTSPNFMRTLDDAWKAHRTRNDIAHRGSDFVLTKRIAKETMEQYRRTFTEFEII